MNISNLNIMVGFVAGFIVAGANLQAQSTAPQIDCKIIIVSNHVGEAVTPAIFNAPNGERIEIQIGLKTINLEDPVAPSGINPNPIPSNGQYFLLKVIRESDGTEMPIKITNIGGGRNLNYITRRIYLEIPDAPQIRRAKAQAAWTKIKTRQPGLGRDVGDTKMVDVLEQDLVENQLGHYKIICTYISNKPGTWNGQVDSTPLRINVLDKGTSLDKMTHQ